MGDSEETAEVIPEKIPTEPESIPQVEPPASEQDLAIGKKESAADYVKRVLEAHAQALRNSCTCGGAEPHGHS
jgi:hypothetical protein